MSTEQDKQDELQKILALKRHETPSPRFFKGFSGKVIDRLHVPETPEDQAWWQRLGLDSKPVLVCASGIAVCALLVVGLVASLRVEPPKPAPRAPDDRTHLVVVPSPNASAVPNPQNNAQPVVGPGAGETPRIGEPVVVSPPSPLNQSKPTSNAAAHNLAPANPGSGGR